MNRYREQSVVGPGGAVPCHHASVHFETTHRLRGTPIAVSAVLSDPQFYLDLELPDLSPPELLSQEARRGGTQLRLRYEFVGDLDPIARRVLGGRRLRWIQEVRVDDSARGGTLSFGAEQESRRLHGDATFALQPDGQETVRHLEGELKVSIPGVSGMAERRIVPGLLRRLDIEAQALNDRLSPA